MNPEQQRIAIAEACGWTETEAWLDGRRCFERADSNAGWDFDSLPNYLNDLNAMHEAEKFILSTDMYIQYVNYLFRSVGLNRTYYMGATPEVFPADRQFAVFHATAAQRAEAFLRTIGKWEEAK